MYRKLRERRMAGLAVRILLVPVFVAVCHLYDWAWLRVLTTVTLVKISALLGVPMHRTAARYHQRHRHQRAVCRRLYHDRCLLWRHPFTVADRHFMVAELSAAKCGMLALFGLNIVRLELGFIAMTKGVPWWLAHEVVAGATYFFLYLYIVKQRAWDDPPRADPNSTPSGVILFRSAQSTCGTSAATCRE